MLEAKKDLFLYKNVLSYFHKIILIIFLFEIIIIIRIKNEYNEIFDSNKTEDLFLKKSQLNLFENKIEDEFKLNGRVNLNAIEASLSFGRKWKKYNFHSHEINVGSSLDPNFIFETIITTASVMASQKSSTKLRLHFSVVKKFKAKHMLKIYYLRSRIREDVEFNFYNASRVEIELPSISDRGPGLTAKLLLPQLLDNNIKKLILIDNGDVLVLKDLSIMYHWDMKNNIYMGAPDIGSRFYGKISQKKIDVYINVGHYLIDIQKVKKKNMYNLFLKYKNVYGPPFAEQYLINDIASGEIGYLPIEFGLVQPFVNDKLFFNKRKNPIFKSFNLTLLSNTSNYIPKTYVEFLYQSYDPVLVHGWYGKWVKGKGMNIYRKLCQYFIELSGMKKEICKKLPGFCQKE